MNLFKISISLPLSVAFWILNINVSILGHESYCDNLDKHLLRLSSGNLETIFCQNSRPMCHCGRLQIAAEKFARLFLIPFARGTGDTTVCAYSERVSDNLL